MTFQEMHFMLDAVQQQGLSLQFASKELQANLKVGQRLGFDSAKCAEELMEVVDACRCVFLTSAWTCHCFYWWMDMNGTCYKILAHTWSILMLRGIWKTFHPQHSGIMALWLYDAPVFSSHFFWLTAKRRNIIMAACCISISIHQVVRAAVKQEGQALRHLALPQVRSIKSKPFKLHPPQKKTSKNLTFENMPS